MNTPDFTACPCQNCNKKIEFDPATLTEENNKITCPYCELETILFVPPATKTPPSFGGIQVVEDQPPPPQPISKPNLKTAKLQRRESLWHWHVEEKLDNAAVALVVAGVMGLVIGAIMAVSAISDMAAWWRPLFLGVAAAVVGYLASLPLRAAAEIIRLLKTQNHLPVEQPVEHFVVFECSKCKTKIAADWESSCHKCGAKFEDEKE
jgi:DNA-directed RNA polymerase subunit RPC12/RpoP/flagellar biosynthesis protein FliQ